MYYSGHERLLGTNSFRGRKGRRSSAGALAGVCLQFRPLASADRQKEFRHPQRHNHLQLSSPKGPQGGHLGRAADGGAASTPRSSLAEAGNASTARPAPRLGCVFRRGRGARRPCQSLPRGRLRILVPLCAPTPRADPAPAPSSAVRARKVRGWVRSAPRPQPRASTAATPRLPRPQPPPWPPPNLSLRHLLRGDAAVASAPGTPAAAAGSARSGARSQPQIPRLARGNCQFQLPRQPGSCSSQPPLANRRRRRRLQGSDCLKQPRTGRLRPAPLRGSAPLAAPPAGPGPAPAGPQPFFAAGSAPCPAPPPPCGLVAARAGACVAAQDPLLVLRGDLSRGGLGAPPVPGRGAEEGRGLRSHVPVLTRVAAPTHPVTARP